MNKPKPVYDYSKIFKWVESVGKSMYGDHFKIQEEDQPTIKQLLVYFLKDHSQASSLGIDLNKGILLTGPIGVGKTALLHIMRHMENTKHKFIIKTCRDISFEFIRDGYEVIHKYTKASYYQSMQHPKVFCFDDLGTEQNLKYFGNETNIMAEILLSRYELFISRKMITHLTTNLSATEIESYYGNRLRSRMREMFNLIAFNETVKDKRQ